MSVDPPNADTERRDRGHATQRVEWARAGPHLAEGIQAIILRDAGFAASQAHRNRVRQNADLSRRFKLIWAVQFHLQKYFA